MPHNPFNCAHPPWRPGPRAASPPQKPARGCRIAAPDCVIVGLWVWGVGGGDDRWYCFMGVYLWACSRHASVACAAYISPSLLLTAGDRHRERSPALAHAAANALRARETSSAEATWLWALGRAVARVLNLLSGWHVCFVHVSHTTVHPQNNHPHICPYVPGLVRQQRHHLGQAAIGALSRGLFG